jgi:hypothetical protein
VGHCQAVLEGVGHLLEVVPIGGRCRVEVLLAHDEAQDQRAQDHPGAGHLQRQAQPDRARRDGTGDLRGPQITCATRMAKEAGTEPDFLDLVDEVEDEGERGQIGGLRRC